MSSTKTKTQYHCARCQRKLKANHWIYSTFTHERYCWPGEGCQRKARSKKARA